MSNQDQDIFEPVKDRAKTTLFKEDHAHDSMPIIAKYCLLVALVSSPEAVTIFDLPFKHQSGDPWRQSELDPLREISIELFGRRRHDYDRAIDDSIEPQSGSPYSISRSSIGLNHATLPRARFYAIASPQIRCGTGIKFVEVKPSLMKAGNGFETQKSKGFPHWDTHWRYEEDDGAGGLEVIKFVRVFAVWDVAELQNEKFLQHVDSLLEIPPIQSTA